MKNNLKQGVLVKDAHKRIISGISFNITDGNLEMPKANNQVAVFTLATAKIMFENITDAEVWCIGVGNEILGMAKDYETAQKIFNEYRRRI